MISTPLPSIITLRNEYEKIRLATSHDQLVDADADTIAAIDNAKDCCRHAYNTAFENDDVFQQKKQLIIRNVIYAIDNIRDCTSPSCVAYDSVIKRFNDFVHALKKM